MVDGGFAYGYLFMSQHPEAPRVLQQFLEIVRPARILEIGTLHGGLTLLLKDILDELNLTDSVVRTYDIHDQEFLKPLIGDRKIEVYTKNLFNTEYDNFVNDDAKNELVQFIQSQGTTIVMCDGGCKRCEFNLLAPLLKKNDIIMAHDYAPNSEYFEQHIKNKIWNWHEIQDSDILDVNKQYSLEPFYQDMTQLVAWCCRRKNV